MSLSSVLLEDLVKTTLQEDLQGGGQDITTIATIPASQQAAASMISRQDGVIAGMSCAQTAFRLMDEELTITPHKNDGDSVKPGDKILSVEGSARAILTAERTALNFLSHLSGVASMTARCVTAIHGTKARVVDTRKTLPGLRNLQKQAVVMGGGYNHRFGLADGILIKDNHIAVSGGIENALDAVANHKSHMVKVEIEVDTLDQLQAVINHGGADIVLLDNMPPEEMAKAVDMIDGRMLAEASGGITLENIRAIAETGVDLISLGALTHSVTALDIGLDIKTE